MECNVVISRFFFMIDVLYIINDLGVYLWFIFNLILFFYFSLILYKKYIFSNNMLVFKIGVMYIK